MVMVTPGTAPPVLSTTLPTIPPRAACADALAAAPPASRSARAPVINQCLCVRCVIVVRLLVSPGLGSSPHKGNCWISDAPLSLKLGRGALPVV